MRSYWWKFLGLVLVLYTLSGGLFTPLKMGITAVSPLYITSGNPAYLHADIYNPEKDFTPSEIILQNAGNSFRARAFRFQEGMLSMEFDPRLGKDAPANASYDLYVKGRDRWMSFPGATSIRKSAADTGAGNSTALFSEQNKPEKVGEFPNKPILNESIRNLLFHVPMWFAMIFILGLAAVYNIRYLNSGNLDFDHRADSMIRMGIVAGTIGCITGSVWARATWGSWWPREDPKLNGVAIAMAMYMAYLLLRSGVRDDYQKARISAVYNLFVFPVFIALVAIMPKLSDSSLHPGSGGTVGFNQYDLNNTLRLYFYPAITGWILVLMWISSLFYRLKKLNYSHD